MARAAVVKFNGYLVNETGLAYSNTYALPLNQVQIDWLSFQTLASSVTVPSVTVDMPAVVLGTRYITGSNAFTTGLAVLYTSTAAIGGLTTNTTYYTGSNVAAFSLATTSTGAIAGTFITFTSTTAGVGYAIKFAPLAITGTPGYKWQVSNDGVNYQDYLANEFNVSVSSVNLTSFNSTGTLNTWDFGPVGYAWIRLNVTGPTTGAIRLQVVGNGKNSSN